MGLGSFDSQTNRAHREAVLSCLERTTAINYDEKTRKDFTNLLHQHTIADNKSVGQVILDINNGGVTAIRLNNWKVR